MVNVKETGPQIAVANLCGTVALKHYNETSIYYNYKRRLNYKNNKNKYY